FRLTDSAFPLQNPMFIAEEFSTNHYVTRRMIIMSMIMNIMFRYAFSMFMMLMSGFRFRLGDFRVADSAFILVHSMLTAPEAVWVTSLLLLRCFFLCQFRMTNKAFVFIHSVLPAPEPVGITILG